MRHFILDVIIIVIITFFIYNYFNKKEKIYVNNKKTLEYYITSKGDTSIIRKDSIINKIYINNELQSIDTTVNISYILK